MNQLKYQVLLLPVSKQYPISDVLIATRMDRLFEKNPELAIRQSIPYIKKATDIYDEDKQNFIDKVTKGTATERFDAFRQFLKES